MLLVQFATAQFFYRRVTANLWRIFLDYLESSRKLQTLKLSVIAISSVVAVEIVLGVLSSSLAVISDGLHALLDTLTSYILFWATRVSLKPPDEEHMYGHGKFESIGGLVGGISLIGVALVIFYEALVRIVANEGINLGFEFAGFIAIGYTFCVDFFRLGIFTRVSHVESAATKASYYHVIADLASTIIALAGFGLAALNVRIGDALASVALSAMLAYLSIGLVRSSGSELSDTVSRETVGKVRKEIQETQGVCSYRELRMRRVGDKTYVETTVQVPEYMTFEESHAVASRVEQNVKSLGNLDVTVHIEPCGSEIHSEKLIEQLARQVKGVKESHEVNEVYTDGKLYITLHAFVDSKLSIREAHEIAEKIEQNIRQRIAEVEDVAIQIEPYTTTTVRGSVVDVDEIRNIVDQIAKGYVEMFRIRRINTYIAGKKRYVNISGTMDTKVSVEIAHRLASEIEAKIRERFADTTVTVHIEPT